MYDPRMDDLLDYSNIMRRRVDLLRDALSVSLSHMPQGDDWDRCADAFVLTDPEDNDPEILEQIEMMASAQVAQHS